MFRRARYPSGKGEVCKTFMRRFDSDPRLQFHIPRKDDSSGAFGPKTFCALVLPPRFPVAVAGVEKIAVCSPLNLNFEDICFV